MEKHFVYINKCKTIEEARTAPRGEKVEIDGRNIVGMFRRGVLVITPEYCEHKLVFLQPGPDGRYWSFSCSPAFASLMTFDKEGDIYGRFSVNDSGQLVHVGEVEGGGSLSDFCKACVTENPEWVMQCFESCKDQYLEFARNCEY